MQSILAVTDFSVSGNRAMARAALLAAEQSAVLTLLLADLAPWQALPLDAAERLQQTARRLERRYGIEVHTIVCGDRPLRRLAQLAERNRLLVLGGAPERGRARWLPALGIGWLLRRVDVPLLVVRSEAVSTYRRLLVALDLSPVSAVLLDLACRIGPQAEIEMFHALGTRGLARRRAAAAAAQDTLARHGETLEREVHRCLWRAGDALQVRRNRVRATLGRGDPALELLVQQEHIEAELIVIGKTRRPAVVDLLCGSVAQRLLSLASSDVLVLPHALEKDVMPAAR